LRVTIEDRGRSRIADQLKDRLDRVAGLRCEQHGLPVVSVTIHARENGWFESQWIACCDRLTEEAAAIVKERC